jgi:hypothetical protein
MDRIVIVSKPSRLAELVRSHLTEGRAKFILESRGQSIVPYKREDDAYRAALGEVRRQIPNDLPVAEVSRDNLPNFLFRDQDLVVVCGPDGLFANTAKYLDEQPVLTVNPDPASVAGVLMLFAPKAVGAVIARAQEGAHKVEALPLIRAEVDGERTLWGINDVFIGRKDQVSARYEVSFDGQSERQSSSGIIVSTGIGATGWLKAVVAMVTELSGDEPKVLSSLPEVTSDELVFVVREPFPTPGAGTTLVTGRITPDLPLSVTSEMPEGGYIFSDGVIEKALEWRAGSTVEISVGDRWVNRIVASNTQGA